MQKIETNSQALPEIVLPLIIGVTRKNAEIEVPAFPHLSAYARSAGITGKLGEAVRTPTPGGFHAPYVIFAGLGDLPGASFPLEKLREAGGNAGRALQDSACYLAFPSESPEWVEAGLEGLLLGAYRFDKYLTDKPQHLQTVQIPDVNVPDPQRLKHLKKVVRAVYDVRDLVNTSPAELYPESLADWMESAASDLPIEVTRWHYKDLKKAGFGGIVAVGRGSKRKPTLVKMVYAPQDAKAHVALVGKGITFDSGGYSLKPRTSMLTMKSDMTGAATMGNAVLLAARLKLPVKVTAWLACAENLVSGTATRVDDVITMKSGKTVEVTNTDAEGRLVLADGLTMATAEKPDLVIDMATLTGAQVVALGGRMAGVMGSAKAQYFLAAQLSGEMAWEMPLLPYLREDISSQVADIANSSKKREGGMILAGVFLREFVGDTPWAHIDIAGPGFNTGSAWGYTPKGGTGYGIRTLVRLFEDMSSAPTE